MSATLPPLPRHLPFVELVAAEGPCYTTAQMRVYGAACAALFKATLATKSKSWGELS